MLSASDQTVMLCEWRARVPSFASSCRDHSAVSLVVGTKTTHEAWESNELVRQSARLTVFFDVVWLVTSIPRPHCMIPIHSLVDEFQILSALQRFIGTLSIDSQIENDMGVWSIRRVNLKCYDDYGRSGCVDGVWLQTLSWCTMQLLLWWWCVTADIELVYNAVIALVMVCGCRHWADVQCSDGVWLQTLSWCTMQLLLWWWCSHLTTAVKQWSIFSVRSWRACHCQQTSRVLCASDCKHFTLLLQPEC